MLIQASVLECKTSFDQERNKKNTASIKKMSINRRYY